MILAAGLTPAWQQILLFDKFRLGEVNRAREAHWCASGKVLNVGIALHRLGGESLTLSLVGGAPRESMERELGELGVPCRWVVSEAPSRVCTTILDASGGDPVMTELVENARPAAPGELDDFERAYAEEAARARIVVLTGSLPRGTPSGFYRRLLERTPGDAVIDARGEELLQTLELEPLVVKPNREELGRTVGRAIGDDRALIEAMGELHRKGAVWCVVSQGKDAIWIGSRRGTTYRLEPPRVFAVNPIGCGDCLAAGTAWAIAGGRDVPEAVRVGAAAAAQNLQSLLPSRLDPQGVEEIAAAIELEKVRG